MFMILMDYLHHQRWSDALVWLDDIPNEACDEFPALLWGISVGLLTHCVAPPLQNIILEGPPIFTDLPLSNDPQALDARRRASALLLRFHEAAVKIGAQEKSDEALEFHLWLRLQDRLTEASAATDIAQRWASSNGDSRWLPLALAANVSIDKTQEASRLDRQATTYGSLNFLDARGRLALILSSRGSEWIDDWNQLRGWLKPYFTAAFLEYHELEALVQLGRTDEARAAIERAEHTPPLMLQRLKLQNDKSVSAVEAMAVFEASSNDKKHLPASLQILVAALIDANDMATASEYAKKLYELTKHHGDAEQWLRLLYKQQRWQEIEEFLDQNPGQVEQSDKLPGLYLEALLRHGRWGDARNVANNRPELTEQRTLLEIQIAVYSCDWDRLWEMLEVALKEESPSLDDMRVFARLATNLGRVAVARKYAVSIADQCNSDPALLMECYMLAVRGRWESDPITAEWVRTAVAQASDEGPIQSKSLEDLAAMMPEWRERTDTLVEGLTKGEVFLSMAARQVSRPLASMMLGPAESNRVEKDFRRRSPVIAFAGVERPSLPETPRSIALDQTALLTLGFLDLLPKVLEGFERLWVPHSIGGWLFAERQEIQFHQPSRIADAKILVAYLATGNIHIAQRHPSVSRELTRRIGSDLAELIEAANVDRSKGTDAYVVRAAPIHLVSSFGQENADVSEHSHVIRSTRELVRSLRFHGAISEDKADRSEAFLVRHDHGWQDDAILPIGATLYLDDLSVSYLHSTGVWGELQNAYRVLIHQDAQREAAELLNLEKTTGRIDEVIEAIRQFVVDGQKSGRLSFLRRPVRGPEADDVLSVDPQFILLQTMEQQTGVEAVVVDDRAANGFVTYTHADGAAIAMRTSLDVLDWLRDSNAIDEKSRRGYRNELRRAGYLLIPVESGELETALEGASVQGEILIEAGAARAIRENHLLAQVAGIARLPGEAAWITNNGAQAAATLARVWLTTDDPIQAQAKSNWLLEYGQWDGLASSMLPPWNEERLIVIDAIGVARLLTNFDLTAGKRRAYNEWIEASVLGSLQLERPRVFDAICEQVSSQLQAIRSFIPEARPGMSESDVAGMNARICKSQLDRLPESVQSRLLEDEKLLSSIGLSKSSRITIGVEGHPSFDVNTLYAEVSKAMSGASDINVQDKAGTSWRIDSSDNLEGVVCYQKETGRRFNLEHAALVSPDVVLRHKRLRAMAEEAGLKEQDLKSWFESASLAPLEPQSLSKLDSDLADAPNPLFSRIQASFENGSIKSAELIPLSRRYYERLVLSHGKSESLSTFAEMLREREQEADLDVVGRVRNELMWSSHSSLVPVSAIVALNASSIRLLCEDLLPGVDIWSLTGLLEALSQRPDASTELLDVLQGALRVFRTSIAQESGRLKFAASIAMLVDGRLSTSGVFTQAPVFWRRHASFAHAALIERAALAAGAPLDELASWAWAQRTRFQFSTMADLTREPRWSGWLMSWWQLKQELIGRVIKPLLDRQGDFEGSLDGLAFGDDPQSLESQRVMQFSGLPGPLEGGLEDLHSLPPRFLAELHTLLNSEERCLAERLTMAAHLASLGRGDHELYARLTQFVNELRASDVTAEERESWEPLFMHLALNAAASRQSHFAKSVIALINDRADVGLSLRLLAGLTACGANADTGEWVASVVDFIESCVRLDLDKSEAGLLLDIVHVLGRSQPMLRPAIGRTIARLQGMAKSIQ
ncbi:hypothetical protein C0063_15545 [Pseudoxanthomonas sp. KAs_5_3]|nr:hypothetical protein C0063_15545 [Pseudoxanthomonas sp. KAs_5_3]